MSLPLFLVGELPSGDEFTLDGPEGRHAATVQRLREGEELLLADGRGGMAQARVKAVAGASLLLSLISRGYAARPEPVLTVAQGIAKGDRGELAVQAMTETGVDEILPWAAARSVAQWRGDRGFKSRDRWVATAREAAKQARRAWVPVIGGEPDVSTKALAKRLDANSLILHEEAGEKLSTVELPASGEIVIVIGPEGGIDDTELAAFQAAGARAVRLGDSVLRTSTAGVAALSVLAVRLGRW
ncbi:ribosomal RNA small subunit methyltransferase E [Rhizocola hellebori]|uniref:Ribosomal RNA small subunit methyltransferase E n=1 Tax=Rhizocola hellebori TaxID=1392758 RepID=A0A8J3Q394_9ACTN|nr:16S rRNA (uracil(1498)-N(3))-methyltransferase [Rhizocola hellebori]GIH03138.1 ribosomal RNA small subunit methyltransferase E [Rhizocola hellebori]